jgi:hypothetical protein
MSGATTLSSFCYPRLANLACSFLIRLAILQYRIQRIIRLVNSELARSALQNEVKAEANDHSHWKASVPLGNPQKFERTQIILLAELYPWSFLWSHFSSACVRSSALVSTSNLKILPCASKSAFFAVRQGNARS